MALLRDRREYAIWDIQAMAKPLANPGNKEERHFYRGKGGVGRGYYKQRVHWSKLGFWSVVAFHWLRWSNLSLVGQGKNCFPPAGVVKYRFLLLGSARSWGGVVGWENFSCWSPDSILFIYFYYLKYFLMFIYFWERERIWSRFQAPSCQHRARHWARTHKLRDHDQSRSQTLNQLSHPGTPPDSILNEVSFY